MLLTYLEPVCLHPGHVRGYDPLEDATDDGRELIALVRAELARRDAAQAGVAGPAAGAELAGRS